MAELGIIPGALGTEGYVELGASPQGRLFRKHLITINKQFLHPKTGKPITLGEDAWRQMKDSFDSRRIIQTPVFTLADENNRHTESPLAVAGIVTALERDGDRVMATIDVKDPAVAERIADGRLPGASAFLSLDAKDPQSGERCGAALLHVCGTLRPALVDLAPYESVVAACGPAWTELPDGSVCPPTLLMLCQSEIDPVPVALADDEPDYQPEPDYYGGPAMTQEDIWRDEIARLGLDAQRESSGLPVRPSYGAVITDHDRQAALSAEELTDEDIFLAAGELAEGYHVSGNAVLAMAHDAYIRSGLGRSLAERARVLGEVQVALSRGQLEVNDEQVLALSQLYDGEAEVLRLTAEPDLEDMFGLAHPAKSGVKVTTETRAHKPSEEDVHDPAQPAGKGMHAEVARLLKAHAKEFGGESLDAGSHNSQSYGPSEYADPGPSGKPQSRERLQAQIRRRGPLSPYEK